jgi:hypothetical protein
VREAFEQVGNDNWGKQNYTNTFFLQRYMFHSDWHLGDWFRVFVQLKSGDSLLCDISHHSGRIRFRGGGSQPGLADHPLQLLDVPRGSRLSSIKPASTGVTDDVIYGEFSGPPGSVDPPGFVRSLGLPIRRQRRER